MLKRTRIITGILSLTAGLLCAVAPMAAQTVTGPIVRKEVHHDTSLPLRDLARLAPPATIHVKHEAEAWRRIPLPPGADQPVDDPVLQRTTAVAAPLNTPTVGLSFDGIGQGVAGFTVGSAPPDTNGAVGATQFVQMVNSSYAVYSKTTGALVLGPVANNTLWSGFGGGCQTNNDGDPVVLYDKIASRWVLTQFSVTTQPYLQCLAVSTTSDATGTYNRYSFSYTNFDDYPKMGVWPDGYYTTFNMFNGNTFVGADSCAYNRTAMLAGSAATQVCFQQGSGVGGLLPADMDGTIQPPAGSPNYQIYYGTNSLQLYKFHVDFATPANSTFTGPTNIPVAAFSAVCGGGTCIPQKGVTQQLDSLADRLMFRLAYRNFTNHESLVVSQSVVAGSSGGVRWYEVQNPNGTPSVAQQSTFAPDSNYRWMSSIAMDSAGDLAVGYSKSSSTLNPSIFYAGRVPGDTPSTLEAEVQLVAGTGSQTGSSLSRWGDYSAMTVDPVDDCTFWYTTEYIKTNGAFNWNTRIGNFKFPGCGTSTPDYTLSASPTSLSVTQGNSGTSTITVNPLSGFTGSVALTASGLPTGVTASFNPTSTTGTSTLTLTASSTATTGTATVTVTGTSGSLSHTTTVSVTVNSAGTPTATLSPSTLTFGSTSVGASSASQAVTLTNSGTGALVITGIGIGTNYSQTNNCGGQVNAGSSCTINVTFTPTTTGTLTGTLTAVDNATPSQQTVTTTGTGVAAADYSLSASPSGLSIVQGNAGTSTITVSPISGFSGSVALSASGLPSGVTAAFSPTSTTSTSTLTLTASGTATTGTSTVTVTGTSGTLTHTTTISLTITASGGGGGAQTAVYDSTLKAPKCATTGSSCDSGASLLLGRATLAGGTEPNQPNTINSTCADGTSGTFHSDESNDRLLIATTDGSTMAPGKSVKVTATVWAYSGFTSDALDLYYAADATNPVWTAIQTGIVPTAAGAQTLSGTFTLPAGSLQAVRAVFRYTGTAGSCTTGAYDDHDDLIFATGAAAPDYSLSASPASVSVTQSSTATSTITVAPLNGFTGSVALTASGLPAGVTAAFSPASTTSTSTLTFTASSTATTGVATVTVTGTSGSTTHTTTISLTVNATGGGAQTAVYDATLKAPKCTTVGTSCDSGATLLNGRGTETNGNEVNRPNTINSSCVDGNSGTYHTDESNDRLKIAATSGNLTHGQTATITATVYAYSTGSSDTLDLYYAPNANSPVWTLIGSMVPAAGGVQTITKTFTLPTGSLQAIRANFRYQGTASSCSTGTYDDHDDLIFAVQ